MTLSVLLAIALCVFCFAAALFIMHGKSFERRFSGLLGEDAVARELRRLDARAYETLHDLLLPSDGTTETTQIDHVVVSVHGIFCIETKVHNGWIYGSAADRYWTQVIHHKKFRFFSPLRQNYAHTQAILRVLGPERVRMPIVSLVTFLNAGKIQVTGSPNVGTLPDTMAAIHRHTDYIYDVRARDEICGLLRQANITDRTRRRQHIQAVQALQQRTGGTAAS